MELSELLKELGAKKKLGDLSVDKSGLCRLLVNQDQLITFEKSINKGFFYLYAAVCELKPEREKELSLIALQGNLFGKETGQASLGYLPKTRSLVLFETFEESSLTFPMFEEKFEQFVRYLSYWINKMKAPSAPSIEDLSLDRHVKDLTQHKNLKIFFA